MKLRIGSYEGLSISAGEIDIVSVDYQSDGRVTVALRTADPATEVRNVRAVVDGVPYPARIANEAALPVSVVIAIVCAAVVVAIPAARAA